MCIPLFLASSPKFFNAMYALVITASNFNFFKKFISINCFTGCITGIKAGVSKTPCDVCNLPILPPRSLYFTSNDIFIIKLQTNQADDYLEDILLLF